MLRIMKPLVTVLMICLAGIYCQEPVTTCLGPIYSMNKLGYQSLYTGQQDFSLALLNAINMASPNENLFFSPYSTYQALLIAFFLSGNQTEMFLRNTLRLDKTMSKNDVEAAYKLDKLRTNFTDALAAYKFTSANKIYVSDAIEVRNCIMNLFRDEISQINFKQQPEDARNKINEWVETRTNNMIKDLLPPGSVDDSTDLVLVNAAYFKGIWLKKFNPAQTAQEIFYVSSTKQIMVDMMHIEDTFNYEVSETLGAHILEMPYKGDNISMYILLPPFSKTNDALENTLSKLTLEEFRKIVKGNNAFKQSIQVSLPKFSLEHTIELVPVLKEIGVGDLFDSTRDFSMLSSTPTKLDKAIHKARIEVTEEGTEAAASTVLFSFRSSRPIEPAQFNCNHPFIYIIFNKPESSILFTGVFRKPN
ncbi:hypothetical protein HHI36_004968 [Cryptolaemus montrouzieri]|uniref:Serpin domain-containing protein n=1 Tax=Cryptolaemus montrouzieri TaxID=559131 RepID=A0ABD2NUC2_9CUCU